MSEPTTNNLIAALYLWGSRIAGAVLGVVLIVQFYATSLDPGMVSTAILKQGAASVGLILLWLVPVLALTTSGIAWVRVSSRDLTGWLAIGIGVFLASLWVLK